MRWTNGLVIIWSNRGRTAGWIAIRLGYKVERIYYILRRHKRIQSHTSKPDDNARRDFRVFSSVFDDDLTE